MLGYYHSEHFTPGWNNYTIYKGIYFITLNILLNIKCPSSK